MKKILAIIAAAAMLACLVTACGNDTGKVADNVKDAVENVKDAAADLAEDAKDAAKGLAEDVKDAAADLKEDVKDAAKDLQEDVKDAVKDLQEDVKDAAKDAAGDVKDAAADFVEDVKDAAVDAAKGLAEDVKDAAADAAGDIKVKIADGVYMAEVSMEGGSGRASIQSPCKVTVKDGKTVATVVWSSDKYDYMIVDDVHYDPVTVEGGSTFEIPVAAFDEAITVIGDTTAMSEPHEIEYQLTFASAGMVPAEDADAQVMDAGEDAADEGAEDAEASVQSTKEDAAKEADAKEEAADAKKADGKDADAKDADGKTQEALADGEYTAEFKTDSSMFHVNEACDGRGTLTVKDGEMTIHISLVSKKIVNLFPGLAEDAQKDGAELLEPTVDTVTYSDGMSEEVYGFDIPVPAIGEEFDVAIIGTSGKWYDHKVSVSDPVPVE